MTLFVIRNLLRVELMKANWKQIALITGISLAVVYASNNELPLVGDGVKKLTNGGTGWF